MEAPISTIATGRDENDEEWGPTEYIRSDLVDKLIGFAVHDDNCLRSRGDVRCNCGLSDLIKELRQ